MWPFLIAQVGRLPRVEPGQLEYRDLANIAIAVLAVVLAIIAIYMARRQEKLTHTLVGVATDLKLLTGNREAERQLEAAKKFRLLMRIIFAKIETAGEYEHWNSYLVHVINQGDKPADDGYGWSIAVNEQSVPLMAVVHHDTDKVIRGIDHPHHISQFGYNEHDSITPGYQAKHLVAHLYVNPTLYQTAAVLDLHWTVASATTTSSGDIHLERPHQS